jgi:small-conductance mechanosensitive channel
MAILSPETKKSQAVKRVDQDLVLLLMLVILATMSIVAVLVVVALSSEVVDQVAPGAILAISGLGGAAIGAFTVALRRSRRATRSS